MYSHVYTVIYNGHLLYHAQCVQINMLLRKLSIYCLCVGLSLLTQCYYTYIIHSTKYMLTFVP